MAEPGALIVKLFENLDKDGDVDEATLVRGLSRIAGVTTDKWVGDDIEVGRALLGDKLQRAGGY